MASVLKTVRAIDESTGEVYYEQKFRTFNGWSDKGYKYRYRYNSLQFFPDNLPRLEPNVMKIFFMICNVMNEENLFLEHKKSKSKYKGPEINIYTVDDIRERLEYSVSDYSFKKAWQQITPRYIKKINVNGKKVWAANPAFACRCKYLPVFLWKAFKEDVNPKLGEQNIRRYENLALTEDL